MEVQEAGTLEESVFRINITRGVVAFLIAGVVLVAVVVYLVLADRPVVASEDHAPVAAPQAAAPISVAPRRYYLTASNYPANAAMTVCTDTFHMAAMWELVDVSNLDYAVDLAPGTAALRGDSGAGPPEGYVGWVRTGHGAATTNTAGQANCSAWTSASGSAYGTMIGLPLDWVNEPSMSIWYVDTMNCNSWLPVWCIED